MMAMVSWDVFAFVAPPGTASVEELPDDYDPPVIGTREEVIGRIEAIAPHVDASDPTWLRLVGPDHLIEVSLREEHPTGMTFFIRGGEGCIPLLMKLTVGLGLVPYDTSTGELMDAASGSASLSGWQTFRNRVVADELR